MRKQELIWLDTAENPEGQMELIIKYKGSTNEENVAAFLEIRDKNSVLVKEKGELRQDTARVKQLYLNAREYSAGHLKIRLCTR